MPEQFMPHRKKLQVICTVALSKNGRYSLAVVANSATGFDGPFNNRRTGAPITIAGAFFVPASPFYGGCAWETFGSAGFLLSRSVNLRTAATLIRLTANRGSSSTIGVSPHARPQSVQNSRRCSSSNGSRRFTRQLQPRYTPFSLQRPFVKGSRPRSRWGCPMSMLPGFSLPEDLLCVSQEAEAGIPIDAITCALDANATLVALIKGLTPCDGFSPTTFRCIASRRSSRATVWNWIVRRCAIGWVAPAGGWNRCMRWS